MTMIFLCGDVMTGRGIDQALPHPSQPRLHEPYVRNATAYMALAREANGEFDVPVGFDYPWGDALAELERRAPKARIANLETAVTTSQDAWRGKGIHYRMHPANVACLTAARLDCCALANNHVLDWGYAGLGETLRSLHAAGIRTAGAGRDAEDAGAPAAIEIGAGARVLVFALGLESSGIPPEWAAVEDRAGVSLLPDLSTRSVDALARRVAARKLAGDVVVLSIHWGGNWGYEVNRAEREFAHAVVEDAGVDVLHGHSSHHPKGIEIHRDRPILYGCGDFINDYEGIGGREEFRAELTLMYFVALDARGALERLELVPMRMRRFRLQRADGRERDWLAAMLRREGKRLGTKPEAGPDGSLAVVAA